MAAQTDELVNTMKLNRTNVEAKYDWDSKGDGKEHSAKVLGIYDGKNFVKTCDSSHEAVGLVLDKTPCYMEQGGQIFDTAHMTSKSGAEFDAEDVQGYAGYVLHIGSVKSGAIKVGDQVGVSVDYARRALIAKNHTATHILNFALRQVLGGKVDQKGSLVDEYKLRFDFAHMKPVETEELARIEQICNQEIAKAHAVRYQEVELAKAKAINGLRAVFGETYPDPVRVVSVGPEIDKLLTDKNTPWCSMNSIEFCGGTHVANSSEIYKLVLQVEEGIAKGVRRIVAVTGAQAAVEATLKTKALSIEVDEITTCTGALLDKGIAEMRTKIGVDKEVSLVMKRDMLNTLDGIKEKQVKLGKADSKAAEKKAKDRGVEIVAESEKVQGDMFVGIVDVGSFDPTKALSFASEATKKFEKKAIMFFCNSGDKVATLAVVPKGMESKVSAKAWSESVLTVMEGKGGGSDNRFAAQFTETAKFDAAVAQAKAFGGAVGGTAPACNKEGKADKKKEGKANKADNKKGGKGTEAEAPKADDPAKKLKKVIKEGGKRGVEIEGAADMGGLQFFCTTVDEPEGDLDLALKCVEAMNVESDPTEEERKGGSGRIGKMVFSAGVEQLSIVAYVPEARQGELSCEEWLTKVQSMFPGGKTVAIGKTYCTGFIPTNADAGIFPLKIRESLILEANNFLRKLGLFPEDTGSDDDEYVFGDDDFPS